MAKLSMFSDGTPRGTRVFNAETGQKIHGIVKVTYTISVHDPAELIIEMVDPGDVLLSGLGDAVVRWNPDPKVKEKRCLTRILSRMKAALSWRRS